MAPQSVFPARQYLWMGKFFDGLFPNCSGSTFYVSSSQVVPTVYPYDLLSEIQNGFIKSD